jgi:hypothetical protein
VIFKASTLKYTYAFIYFILNYIDNKLERIKMDLIKITRLKVEEKMISYKIISYLK